MSDLARINPVDYDRWLTTQPDEYDEPLTEEEEELAEQEAEERLQAHYDSMYDDQQRIPY